jgi:transcriptional regulator with XRE-family HTH domain
MGMGNILHSQDQSRRPDVLAHVGENLRRLRGLRGFSQAELATRSGISRRMIGAMEGNDANVSLSTLDRLAAALDISLTELVRSPDAADNRRINTVAWRGAHADSSGVLLGSAPATREAELWLWSLAEGERYPSEADSQNWHEMLSVIEGMLVIEAAEETHTLRVGDFLIFSSARPYVFANGGEGAVRFIRNVVL